MELAPILFIIFISLAFILWIWAIIDILKKNFKKQPTSVAWILIVILFPLVGSFAYFLSKKDTRKKEFNPKFNN